MLISDGVKPHFSDCKAVFDIRCLMSDFRGGLAHSFSGRKGWGYFFGSWLCRSASYASRQTVEWNVGFAYFRALWRTLFRVVRCSSGCVERAPLQGLKTPRVLSVPRSSTAGLVFAQPQNPATHE